MASFTPYLDLLKKSPITDGDDTFNVDTMLNENWDKIDAALGDTTTPAKKLGLTGDLSVGASLGVLATAGDLHVWRRTVSSLDGKPETPAGYKLGEVQSGQFTLNSINAEAIYFTYADDVSVSSQGTVSIGQTNRGIATVYGGDTIEAQKLIGKFIQATRTSGSQWTSDLTQNEIYFIPKDAEVTKYNNRQTYVSKYQTVTGYPYQPAVPPGTVTVDYPVSTNEKAYQTGSDAKPAGYTLGAEQQALVKSLFGSSAISISYSDSVSVSDDGTVTLVDYQTDEFKAGTSNVSMWNVLKGKFYGVGTSVANYYVPDNAVFSAQSNGDIYVDKRQTVTGYPAIPAGTTIEYLGQLGDKSRMQIVSYVGTGTYGASNPCSITADFPIEVAECIGFSDTSNRFYNITDGVSFVIASLLTASYVGNVGFDRTAIPTNAHSKKSSDGKTITWYNTNSDVQLNSSGYTYYFLCRE